MESTPQVVRESLQHDVLQAILRELEALGIFEQACEQRRAREAAESTRRVRKLMRKRMEREGY